MTPERSAKIERVASLRQLDLAVVLENVHDPHNIGAVLRSCDSVGIQDVYILHTDPRLIRESVKLSHNVAAGALKWLNIHYHTQSAACLREVQQKYSRVLSTRLGPNSANLYELNLTQPTAFLFGNEHSGLSSETQAWAAQNFMIPQMGMVQSLNISVACAVTLYECYRQRFVSGHYAINEASPELLKHFAQRSGQNEPRKIKRSS